MVRTAVECRAAPYVVTGTLVPRDGVPVADLAALREVREGLRELASGNNGRQPGRNRAWRAWRAALT